MDQTRRINNERPEWFCYNNSDKELLLVDDREAIMYKIKIDGLILKSLWDKIQII